MVVTKQLIFYELFAQLSPRATTLIMDVIFSIEIDKQVQNAIVLTTLLITHHLHTIPSRVLEYPLFYHRAIRTQSCTSCCPFICHLLLLTRLDKPKVALFVLLYHAGSIGLLYSTHTTVEPDVLLPAAQLSS